MLATHFALLVTPIQTALHVRIFFSQPWKHFFPPLLKHPRLGKYFFPSPPKIFSLPPKIFLPTNSLIPSPAICSYWTGCGNCTAVTGCGWCCGTQQCLAGDATSPSGGVSCPTWQSGSCGCTPGCGTAGTCVCGKCQCDIGRTGATCDQYIGCDGLTYNTPAELPALDTCGVCKGDNSTCLGCDGIPFGSQYDHCGVCGGDGKSCADGCGYVTDCGACLAVPDDKCQWCYSASFCADRMHTYECPDNNFVTTNDRCVQSKRRVLFRVTL
jgi:hypothetical protein